MSDAPIEERLDELACDFQANASSGILGYIIEETQERATLLREAASVIRRLRGVKAVVRPFLSDVLQVVFEAGDLTGGEIQDYGVKHGVLVETTVTEACGEACSCAENGDFPQTCYRLNAILESSSEEGAKQ